MLQHLITEEYCTRSKLAPQKLWNPRESTQNVTVELLILINAHHAQDSYKKQNCTDVVWLASPAAIALNYYLALSH